MKKIIALIMALALVLSLSACGGSKTDNEDTTAESVTAESESVTDEITEESTEPGTTEPEKTTAEAVSESETQTEESKTEEESEIAAPPASKAEIIALYNKSVNDAYGKKAGFSKERYTDNESFDMSVALRAFKSLVEKFVGIGEENKYTEKVTKGQWDSDAKRHYLRKSTLTEADVTNATCTESDGAYIVTLNVKGGNSEGSKDSKFTNAPIDKSGICVGNEDKGYYDHKTGEVIYDAVAGTYAGANIKEKYDNAKVVARINPATGELISLTVTFDITVNIDIGIGSGSASGTTHIIYKDFKF